MAAMLPGRRACVQAGPEIVMIGGHLIADHGWMCRCLPSAPARYG
jgi:hypothetical protein